LSSIIVDGYNVIGVLHADMEAERRRFIESLMQYRKRKGHEITVVFDGWREGRGSEQSSVTGGVRVMYSALGEKADAVIKRMITGTGRQWIVISSDRDIQAHAWARGAVPVGAEDFLRSMEIAGGQGEQKADEDEYDRPQRKGNPRQPSKKEKALKKALEKL
jgi:predicted RNA-binding protein with PIN domain